MKNSSRRDFLKTSAVAGGALAINNIAANAFQGGNDLVKVGLVGCGGRGTGAVTQNLNADSNCKLVAVAESSASGLGNCRPRLACTLARSARACATVMPGFKRPMPVCHVSSRPAAKDASSLADDQRSTPRCGNTKAAGMTPIIREEEPANRSVLPTTFGSPAKRLRQ